jgi:sulfur-oxidizing protein SoxY
MQRRDFVKMLFAVSALALVPVRAFAAMWNVNAFESTKLNSVLNGLGITEIKASKQITIIAPDKAENGAVVQIEVRSEIANTESLAILVENNPTPLIAHFVFSEGADAYIVTRIKMAETSDVEAIVKVGNQYFSAKKRVEVLENGCG